LGSLSWRGIEASRAGPDARDIRRDRGINFGKAQNVMKEPETRLDPLDVHRG
jgi:hypothetical protein